MANHGGAHTDQPLMSKRSSGNKSSGLDSVDQKTVLMNNHQKERENHSKPGCRQRHTKNASFVDTVSTGTVVFCSTVRLVRDDITAVSTGPC